MKTRICLLIVLACPLLFAQNCNRPIPPLDTAFAPPMGLTRDQCLTYCNNTVGVDCSNGATARVTACDANASCVENNALSEAFDEDQECVAEGTPDDECTDGYNEEVLKPQPCKASSIALCMAATVAAPTADKNASYRNTRDFTGSCSAIQPKVLAFLKQRKLVGYPNPQFDGEITLLRTHHISDAKGRLIFNAFAASRKYAIEPMHNEAGFFYGTLGLSEGKVTFRAQTGGCRVSMTFSYFSQQYPIWLIMDSGTDYHSQSNGRLESEYLEVLSSGLR